MLSTSTELDVMMGERRPEVGKVRKKKEQNEKSADVSGKGHFITIGHRQSHTGFDL